MSSCRGTSSLSCKMQLWWLSGGESKASCFLEIFLARYSSGAYSGSFGTCLEAATGSYAAWLGHVGLKLLLTWHGMPIRW